MDSSVTCYFFIVVKYLRFTQLGAGAVAHSFALLCSVLWYQYAQSPPPPFQIRKGEGREVSELSLLYYALISCSP